MQKDTSEEDRRTAPRVKVNLPARWEGVLFHQEAAVTSLSRTGCFVLTAGKVQENELIWLEISLPNQQPVYLWAEVVDQAYEIGFAVSFNSSSGKDDVQRLDSYIQNVAEKTREQGQ
jgi:hypothetical protein